MFAAIRNNLSSTQTQEIATQFKNAKARIQQRLGEPSRTRSSV